MLFGDVCIFYDSFVFFVFVLRKCILWREEAETERAVGIECKVNHIIAIVLWSRVFLNLSKSYHNIKLPSQSVEKRVSREKCFKKAENLHQYIKHLNYVVWNWEVSDWCGKNVSVSMQRLISTLCSVKTRNVCDWGEHWVCQYAAFDIGIMLREILKTVIEANMASDTKRVSNV